MSESLALDVLSTLQHDVAATGPRPPLRHVSGTSGRDSAAASLSGDVKVVSRPTESFDLPALSPHIMTSERVRRRSEAPALAPGSILRDIEESAGGDQAPVPSAAPVYSFDVRDASAGRAAMRRRGRAHFAVLCWVLFLNGWNDGSAGPLIPTIQRVYHVRPSPSPSPTPLLRPRYRFG
jgi:hypothetical protein